MDWENSCRPSSYGAGGAFGIPGDLNISSVTRVQRQQFCHLVKNLPLTVKGPRDIQEAVITRGGIPVKEVDPSTMESKLVKGLYFAGEM